MISILTLNTALLTIYLFGIPIYGFNPDVTRRREKIITFLSTQEEDFLALQEVSRRSVRKMTAGLEETFPYSAFAKSHTFLGTGILTFSKHPILSSVFIPFKTQSPSERLVLQKGMQVNKVKNGDQEFTIINVHLIAYNWLYNSAHPKVMTNRKKQIEQLIEYVDSLPENEEVVVVGDFNCAPEFATENYEQLTAYFTDLFVLDEERNGTNKIRQTWMSDNTLNDIGGRGLPSQRVDHMFIPKKETVTNLQLEINPEDQISDHHPMEMEMEIN